jgi:predicted MPP superfamily phosphohydrolase
LSLFLTRRKFLQIGAGAAVGALAIAGDGTIFEANRPQLVSIEVPLARLDESWDGFRIAQLSDFHYDDLFSAVPLRKAVDIVNQQLQPDLVVLTGDFVTSPLSVPRHRSARGAAKPIEACSELLSKIRASSGILAALGNHDMDTDGNYITAVLQSHAIPVLRNRSVSFERGGKRLWFSGVDDVLAGRPDLDLALRGIPPGEPVILLAHEPDWADYVASRPVDLQLSGHSHGGQVRLPLVGAVYLPKLGRKYPWGLRRIGPLTLYTNVGIGTIRVPVRLNCPPEITLITLRAHSGGAPQTKSGTAAGVSVRASS